MAVPAGPPILLLVSLRAFVLGGRRSLAPLSSHTPFMVSLRIADDSGLVGARCVQTESYLLCYGSVYSGFCQGLDPRQRARLCNAVRSLAEMNLWEINHPASGAVTIWRNAGRLAVDRKMDRWQSSESRRSALRRPA
jgi:hypothetical protein